MNNSEKAKQLRAIYNALQNAALNFESVTIAVHIPLDDVSNLCYSVKAETNATFYHFDADGELLRPRLGEPVSREICKRKLKEFLNDES